MSEHDPRSEETIFSTALHCAPAERAPYLDEACAGQPALRERIEELLKAQPQLGEFMENPADIGTPGAPETIRLTVPPEERPGTRIGRYKLLQKIGEGGCGVVYMAEQEEPVRRRVALKVIKLGMDTKSVIARFEAERQALAMMDHPNIAKVLDGGATETGRPYFVMELVRGIKITEFCDQNRLPTRERLDLFIQVCQAVQHAHQKGIIHRDLKPSNILVTLHDPGTPGVPMIIDFGIAKATQGRLTDQTLFTAFEQFLGTPAYMSPEQAMMTVLDIDTRSDIYSLGVLLYELLTGHTPFDAKELLAAGFEEMRRTIREKEPLRPSTRLSTLLAAERTIAASFRQTEPPKLVHLVCGDLDWIVMKCLEKDRARRYETANGLAADLQRHLSNEPVVARPPSRAYRLWKAWRRNTLALSAAAALVCALALGVVVSTWQMVRAVDAEKAEQKQAEQARAHRDRAAKAEAKARVQATVAKDAWAAARRQAYAAEINVAFQAVAESNLARANDLLNHQRPKPGEEDLRGFEWRYLWQLCQPDEKATFDDGGAHGIAFSPDGKWLAFSGGRIDIRNVEFQTVVAMIPSPANTLMFSPRAKLLASGHDSGVRLWSTESWKEVRTLPGAVLPAVFSPDGQWLVTGSDGGYRVWSTETWEPTGSCPVAVKEFWQLRNAVAFSPDGKLLVTPGHRNGSDSDGFQVRDFPSLTPRTNFAKFDGNLGSAAFAPDGKHLLIGHRDGVLLVWNVAEGKVVETLREHTGWITAITFPRDGMTFATASADRTLIVWDAATWRPLVRLRGHMGEVWSAALSPDGRKLVSGSFDGTTKLWDTTTRHEGRELAGSAGVIGYTADSRLLVVGSKDEASLWHLADGATKRIPNRNDSVQGAFPTLLGRVSKSSDARGSEPLWVQGRLDGSLELWNLATRTRVASWPAHEGPVTVAAFSQNGQLIATSGTNGDVRLWETTTHLEVKRFEPLGVNLWSLAFSPDGRLLAGGGHRPSAAVWETVSGRLLLQLGDMMPHFVGSVAFSPSGDSLAISSIQGNTARIYDIPSGTLRATLKGHIQGVYGVTFAPDGKTLATGSDDRKVKLWNISTEQEVATLPLPGRFSSFKFSPDGRTLAVGYDDGGEPHIQLWQAPSFEEIAAIEAKESAELKQP